MKGKVQSLLESPGSCLDYMDHMCWLVKSHSEVSVLTAVVLTI